MLGFQGWLMSRIQWRFQAVSVALAFSLAGSAMAASVAATRLHEVSDIDAPNKEGSTPLLEAVMQDHLDAAKHLLARGAKANAANRYRVTPLYVATLHGNADMMAVLLAASADPNGAAPSGEHQSCELDLPGLSPLDPLDQHLHPHRELSQRP
jgi:ankyrin repeat protein